MRGLFTLLFGAGALLFLQRHAARNPGLLPADLYFRRTMWLIVFGLVNGYLLLWDGDILFYYGVVGLLLFVFRNVAPRKLIVAAAVIMILQTAVTVIEWYGYHEDQRRRRPPRRKAAAQARADRATEPGSDRNLREDQRGVQASRDRARENGQPHAQELRQRARRGRTEDAGTSKRRSSSARPARKPGHDAARHGAAETTAS